MQLCYKNGGYANRVKTHLNISPITFLKILKVTRIKSAAFSLIKAQLLGDDANEFVPKSSVFASEDDEAFLLTKAG